MILCAVIGHHSPTNSHAKKFYDLYKEFWKTSIHWFWLFTFLPNVNNSLSNKKHLFLILFFPAMKFFENFHHSVYCYFTWHTYASFFKQNFWWCPFCNSYFANLISALQLSSDCSGTNTHVDQQIYKNSAPHFAKLGDMINVEVFALSGCDDGALDDWCPTFWENTWSLNVGHQSPSDTVPYPRRMGP